MDAGVGVIPLRLYLYGALALALGWLLWREHSLAHKLTASRAETAAEHQRAEQATVQIAAERAARAHEQEIATHASQQFQSTVTALQSELAIRPLGPVYIRVRDKPAVPAASGSAAAATGSHAEAEGRLDGSTEIDIAPELTAYGIDCQMNSAMLESLQGWVRSR